MSGTKRTIRASKATRVALVTGGGRGIGRAVCLALGKAGVAVAVNYRSRKKPAENVAEEIRASGGEARVVCADVSLSGGAEAAIEATIRSFGRLDILVNNVGDFLQKPILNMKSDEWCGILRSNLDSVFNCSLRAIPHMKRRRWGRIVNIGVAGCDDVRAFPNTTAYNIAKTGVLILSKSLAKDVASLGITVNVIAPGMVDTEAVSRAALREIEKKIPAKRAADPDEIARVVTFLVSDGASYITGACVTISGGWLL